MIIYTHQELLLGANVKMLKFLQIFLKKASLKSDVKIFLTSSREAESIKFFQILI